jgi:hypothetical protein
MKVAPVACQRQVFGDVQAAMLLCNDVFDMVEEPTVLLM